MAELVIRPSNHVDDYEWVLQLRYHDCCGSAEYVTITRLKDGEAKLLVDEVEGKPYFLNGDPRRK